MLIELRIRGISLIYIQLIGNQRYQINQDSINKEYTDKGV